MAGKISGESGYDDKVIKLSEAMTDEPQDYEDNFYEKKIKAHRRNVAVISIITAILVVVLISVVIILLDGRTYSSYAVTKSVNRDLDSDVYVAYQGGYIKYSNDGASYYNSKGTEIWNHTYSMQSPKINICNESIAIGDMNGSSVYLFNDKGYLGNVDTSLPISQVDVADNGVVAAVLEDSRANYINLYDTNGNKIYTVKTTVDGDGYPVDISISPDATKLMASFLYVTGESMKTNVVFYNFSEVGENETERIVGGYSQYETSIVGDVEFLDNTTAVAVGEDVVSVYKIKEYPTLQNEISIDSKVTKVFFDKEYIGLVLDNVSSGDVYKLVVYDTFLHEVFSTTYNMLYQYLQFDGKSVIMNNSTTFSVVNFKGKILTTQSFDMSAETMIKTGRRGEYIIIGKKYIQNIRLD